MWQGIYGHDQVVERFQKSLANGRLASCYLFLGPEGVGKRAFAIQLAKALLCPETESGKLESCNQCESCRLVEAGNHPDLEIVSLPPGKRTLPLELFVGDREHRNQEGLCHKIALKPMMGRRRIAIIDDADWFKTESANCLLKTLEEPPPGTVLILVGTNRSRQLPTILSRAQVVRFQPLPTDIIRRLLLEQDVVSNEREAQRLAAISGGSLSRAEASAEMGFDEFQARFEREFDSEALDGPRLTKVISEFVHNAGTEAEARRKRLRVVFGKINQRLSEDLRANAADASPRNDRLSRVLAALDRCLQAEEQLDRNANLATLVECWADDLVRILTD